MERRKKLREGRQKREIKKGDIEGEVKKERKREKKEKRKQSYGERVTEGKRRRRPWEE